MSRTPTGEESPREVYYEHLDEMRRECEARGLLFVEELTRTIRAWFVFQGITPDEKTTAAPRDRSERGRTEFVGTPPDDVQPGQRWRVTQRDGDSVWEFVRWSNARMGAAPEACVRLKSGAIRYVRAEVFARRIREGLPLPSGGAT